MQKTAYQPISCSIYDQLEALATKRAFVRIHYFDDIKAYYRTTAVIKDFKTEDKAEYMILSTGEKIRLDRLVKVNNILFPGFTSDEFTCDC